MSDYTASRVDLSVERTLMLSEIATEEARLEVTREILEELVDYFGFAVTPEVFDAQIRHTRAYGGLDPM